MRRAQLTGKHRWAAPGETHPANITSWGKPGAFDKRIQRQCTRTHARYHTLTTPVSYTHLTLPTICSV
eukprot:537614-Alexandrium_andersonii.AAC.1